MNHSLVGLVLLISKPSNLSDCMLGFVLSTSVGIKAPFLGRGNQAGGGGGVRVLGFRVWGLGLGCLQETVLKDVDGSGTICWAQVFLLLNIVLRFRGGRSHAYWVRSPGECNYRTFQSSVDCFHLFGGRPRRKGHLHKVLS